MVPDKTWRMVLIDWWWDLRRPIHTVAREVTIRYVQRNNLELVHKENV